MPIHCKAAIAKGQGNFIIDEIEVQEPKADEVLVKMKAAGLCHTDYDSINWGKPLVMGHEGSGIVEKTGKAVKGIFPGDHVILNWATPCGCCFQCLEGNQNICEIIHQLLPEVMDTPRDMLIFQERHGEDSLFCVLLM